MYGLTIFVKVKDYFFYPKLKKQQNNTQVKRERPL